MARPCQQLTGTGESYVARAFKPIWCIVPGLDHKILNFGSKCSISYFQSWASSWRWWRSLWGTSPTSAPMRIFKPCSASMRSLPNQDHPCHDQAVDMSPLQVWQHHRVRQVDREALWLCPHGRLPGHIQHHQLSIQCRHICRIRNLTQPVASYSFHPQTFTFTQTSSTRIQTQSAQQAVRKLGGLAYKGKRLKVELSNS